MPYLPVLTAAPAGADLTAKDTFPMFPAKYAADSATAVRRPGG
jgi:hypothetical protein